MNTKYIPAADELGYRKLPSEKLISNYLTEQFNLAIAYEEDQVKLADALTNFEEVNKPVAINHINLALSFGTKDNTISLLGPAAYARTRSFGEVITDPLSVGEVGEMILKSGSLFNLKTEAIESLTIASGKNLVQRLNAINGFVNCASRELHKIVLSSFTNNGYMAIRGEYELDREIDTRKEQYPSSQIYVFGYGVITEYLESYRNLGFRHNGCIYVNLGWNYSIDRRASAVVAEEQLAAIRYRWLQGFSLERGNRKWTLRHGMIGTCHPNLTMRQEAPKRLTKTRFSKIIK